jgi:hypothetical protein
LVLAWLFISTTITIKEIRELSDESMLYRPELLTRIVHRETASVGKSVAIVDTLQTASWYGLRGLRQSSQGSMVIETGE